MHLARPHLRALTIDWRWLTAMALALIGLIAAALAWIAYSYAARTEPLIVAATAIAPGTRLTSEMLTVIQAPLIRPEPLRGLPDPARLIGRAAYEEGLSVAVIAARFGCSERTIRNSLQRTER